MGVLRNVLRSPLHDPNQSPLDEFGPFLPSDLAGLKLWTRFNSGITITGSGVSQWDDVSGNGNHLLQGTDASRPSKEVDGSILFDGIDDALKAVAFTLVQPETVYILGKQITWTNQDRWFDGEDSNSGTLLQNVSTPEINLYAGSFLTNSISITLDTDVVISSVLNSDNSVLQLNNDTPSTAGTIGAANMGGFTLAGKGGPPAQFANVQIKEVIVFNTAHDETARSQIINYLAGVGGLSI